MKRTILAIIFSAVVAQAQAASIEATANQMDGTATFAWTRSIEGACTGTRIVQFFANDRFSQEIKQIRVAQQFQLTAQQVDGEFTVMTPNEYRPIGVRITVSFDNGTTQPAAQTRGVLATWMVFRSNDASHPINALDDALKVRTFVRQLCPKSSDDVTSLPLLTAVERNVICRAIARAIAIEDNSELQARRIAWVVMSDNATDYGLPSNWTIAKRAQIKTWVVELTREFLNATDGVAAMATINRISGIDEDDLTE